MEISKLILAGESKTQATSLSATENSKSKTKSSSVSNSVVTEVDTQDLSSLENIKSYVANAKQSQRAAYVASLKEAIEAGSYNTSTQSIVDAMFADGTIEALI
jgi:anti-sigma28 factor (negative regulator of flagellin synthesis)